jgi:type III pantothenate kinase
MLLTIDIGNTNVVFGAHDGSDWVHTGRVETVRTRMADEYAVLFHALLGEAGLTLAGFDRTIISSVVPQLTRGMVDMVTTRSGRAPMVLGPHLDLGIEVRTEHPHQIGSDLVANAVAGYHRFGENSVVVNTGTATTLTAVAAPGHLLGVAIAAGLIVTSDALVGRSAQLPHVPLESPPSVIGRNTTEAMQSGLVLGHVAMIEGLLARMKAQLGGAKVIATGGLTGIIAPLTDQLDEVDPWLTLDGLRIIAERN